MIKIIFISDWFSSLDEKFKSKIVIPSPIKIIKPKIYRNLIQNPFSFLIYIEIKSIKIIKERIIRNTAAKIGIYSTIKCGKIKIKTDKLANAVPEIVSDEKMPLEKIKPKPIVSTEYNRIIDALI